MTAPTTQYKGVLRRIPAKADNYLERVPERIGYRISYRRTASCKEKESVLRHYPMLDKEHDRLLAIRDEKATAIRITLSLSLSGSTSKRKQCALECLRAMRRQHEVMHVSWF